MDLSIIIVNYCTYQLTKQAIDSLIDTIEGISYEIIVVDNASGDDSLNRLIKDYENTSFVSFCFFGGKRKPAFKMCITL